jgi:hypothetical protein
MTPRCIGTPISWLRLEQYLIDELPRATRREVERHLAACEVCTGCLELAQRTQGALLALPAAARPVRRRSWPRLLSAAALLAGLVLMLRPSAPDGVITRPGRIAIKGGELAIQLIRERDGEQRSDPTRFLAGDRFRILRTCPPGSGSQWDLVIFQDGTTSFPLERSALECGNAVALPGAFRLTRSASATVCLVLDPPARSVLRSATPATLPEQAVCQRLEPQ